MKYLLLIFLSVSPTLAATPMSSLAPPTATSGTTATKTDTSVGTTTDTNTSSVWRTDTTTGTTTATSTSTATAPPPPPVGGGWGGGHERIDNWVASKFNPDLLKDPALVDNPDATFKQSDLYKSQSNILYRCVEKSVDGRNDEICKRDANHPECVGLNRALRGMTNCKEYFDPPELGCKEYGTNDYTLEEWLAVGEKYATSMTNCAEVRVKNATRSQDIKSLTEMHRFDRNDLNSPNTPSKANDPFDQDSNISGDLKKDPSGASIWEDLAGKIDDGASYLGYEKGDILKSIGKGEKFGSIVSTSPFAEKLNAAQRLKLENGLENSGDILARVAEKRQAAEAQAAERAGEPAPDHEIANIESESAPAEGSSISSAAPASAPENAATASLTPKSVELGRTQNSALIPPVTGEALTQAQRIEAIAQEAARARREKRSYRGPASVMSAPAGRAEDHTDTSIFQRVSHAYRRQSPGLRPLRPSATGDSIRALDQPEIFRNL